MTSCVGSAFVFSNHTTGDLGGERVDGLARHFDPEWTAQPLLAVAHTAQLPLVNPPYEMG